MAASNRAAHLKGHQFKQGQSGNPRGRKKGCRPQLCEAFLEDLLSFWQSHGDELLTRAMEENPAALVAVIARLLPKDFQVTVAGAVQVSPELTAEQRQKIAEAWMLSQQARSQGRLVTPVCYQDQNDVPSCATGEVKGKLYETFDRRENRVVHE